LISAGHYRLAFTHSILAFSQVINTALWLLTRPDCRALRSVVTLFDELGGALKLPSVCARYDAV
jgi:hypothetical protein